MNLLDKDGRWVGGKRVGSDGGGEDGETERWRTMEKSTKREKGGKQLFPQQNEKEAKKVQNWKREKRGVETRRERRR